MRVVTDEQVQAVAWSASSKPGQPFGMILTDDDIRNILTIGIANAPAALSHVAEAVEPEQKPVAWRYRPDWSAMWQYADTHKPSIVGWIFEPLFAHPVRSAQEAVKVRELEAIAKRIIEDVSCIQSPTRLSTRTVEAIVYAARKVMLGDGNDASPLLPPGGETATPDTPAPDSHVRLGGDGEHRRTFTVPPGYEPVFDENGRATGEIRPALSEKRQ